MLLSFKFQQSDAQSKSSILWNQNILHTFLLKIIYFIAPQSKDEIFRINDPYYVSEFNLMLESFASRFINANTDVDLSEFKQFPSVIGVDNIIKIDGSKTVERFTKGESKLLGQQVINK